VGKVRRWGRCGGGEGAAVGKVRRWGRCGGGEGKCAVEFARRKGRGKDRSRERRRERGRDEGGRRVRVWRGEGVDYRRRGRVRASAKACLQLAARNSLFG